MSFALSRLLAPVRSRLPSAAVSYSLTSRLSYSTSPPPYNIPAAPRVAPVKGHHTESRFKEFDLQDRVYAITGGARGLGLAMAEALLEAGAKGMTSYNAIISTSQANGDFYESSLLLRPTGKP